jgi:hypothetical protein
MRITGTDTDFSLPFDPVHCDVRSVGLTEPRGSSGSCR